MTKIIEGYLYIQPYVGDLPVVTSKKPDIDLRSLDLRKEEDLKKYYDALTSLDWDYSILDWIEKHEGKKVRVIEEEERLVIEVLEG